MTPKRLARWRLISVGQAKLLLGLGIVIATIVGIVRFIYRPRQAQGQALKQEIVQVDQQIQAVYQLFGGFANFEHGLASVRQQLNTLQTKLPTEEQFSRLLDELSSDARRFGIVVNAITPMLSSPVFIQKQQPAMVEGLVCERLPITLQLQATYRALGEYLASLKDKPFLIGVDHVSMSYNPHRPGWIDATVILSTYTLKPPSATIPGRAS